LSGKERKRSRFTEEQILFALKQVAAGRPVADVCRQMGISEAASYVWKKRYGNLGLLEIRELRQLRSLPSFEWRISLGSSPGGRLDVKKRFSEEQIIGFLKEADQGLPVKELCRKRGFSEASFYLWRSNYGGMSVSDATRLKALEAENAQLKKLLAESLLGNEVPREAPTSPRFQ
jgi:putative transposase